MDSYNRVNQVEFKVQVKRDFINQEVAYRWQSNFYNEKTTKNLIIPQNTVSTSNHTRFQAYFTTKLLLMNEP